MAGALQAALRWRSYALPALFLLGITTAFVYWQARRCGLISDAWVLIGIARTGLPDALFVKLSYHIIPVTHLLTVLLWKTFGRWEPGYQLTNLAELALSGWLLYFLGLRLFRRPQIALLAALLLVANSSFYEVTLWPVIGNFQILAGLLHIAGVLTALRAASSPRPAPWAALFGLLAVVAFFTYEPAVSLLATGVLAAALVPPADADRAWYGWRRMLRRSAPVLIAAVLAFIPMVTVKLAAAQSGHTALFLPGSLYELRMRLEYLVRACLGIFSLRGSDAVVYHLYHLGLPQVLARLDPRLLLVLWLSALGSLTLLVLVRTRQPAVRFLVLWFWVHVSSVSLATVIVSRMFYLAALPASLLLAWAISRSAEAAARRIARGEPAETQPRLSAAVGAALAFLAFGLLAAGAKVDINAGAELHREATVATRRIVEALQTRTARGVPPRNVVLVNMPAKIVRDGMGAYFFVNGLHEMLAIAANGAVPRESLRLLATDPAARPGPYANGTAPSTMTEIDRLVRDPSALVLWFDPRSHAMVELDPLTWRVPREYTPASAPFLPWGASPWDWLEIRAGLPQELLLELPEPGAWGIIRFLRPLEPLRFDVVENGATRLEVRPLSHQSPYWSTLPFPISAEGRRAALTVKSETRVQMTALWAWAPPSRYTPETAPFLAWWSGGSEPTFTVPETIRLPVATPACVRRACAVRVKYLAEPGRAFTLMVEGGERRELAAPAGTVPAWQTLDLASGSRAPVTVLRVEPRGPLPVTLATVAASGAAVETSVPASRTDTLQWEDRIPAVAGKP